MRFSGENQLTYHSMLINILLKAGVLWIQKMS